MNEINDDVMEVPMQMQTELSANPSRFLLRVIRANALYCAGAGLGMFFFPASVAGWLGITQNGILALFGVVMVCYAAILWWGGWKRLVEFARIATALDLLWIAGSLLILFTNWLPLTRVGIWAVALAADGVLIFAVLQLIGLRRHSQHNS
jgi:hypothetical protein